MNKKGDQYLPRVILGMVLGLVLLATVIALRAMAWQEEQARKQLYQNIVESLMSPP